LRAFLVIAGMVAVILLIIVGGVIGFRAVKQADVRPASEFSVMLSVPQDFVCEGYQDTQTATYIVTCSRR
jgi:hypothetical protein